MEDHDFEKMTPFDQLISTQSLQILKLLIPYTPPENQRFLAVYTKFLELQHTIDFFQRFHSDVYSQDFEKKTFSPFHIIQEIRPYIPAQFGETFDMLMNMMDMMEVFQNMNETADSDGNTDPDFDPMAMMKNMLAPEQQAMFDMYKTKPKTKKENKNMIDWLNDPMLKNMDPIKVELIKTAAAQTSGKSGRALAPVLMTLITNANKKGIRFSPDEISLILELIKEGKTQKEKEQIDRTIQMVMSMLKKQNP